LLYSTLLTDRTLFDALVAIDHELAATTQAEGCPRCGGRLHQGLSPEAARRTGGSAERL
jgi:hypothetical protein